VQWTALLISTFPGSRSNYGSGSVDIPVDQWFQFAPRSLYCHDLTIPAGYTLVVRDGSDIFCTGTLTVNGVLSVAGGDVDALNFMFGYYTVTGWFCSTSGGNPGASVTSSGSGTLPGNAGTDTDAPLPVGAPYNNFAGNGGDIGMTSGGAGGRSGFRRFVAGDPFPTLSGEGGTSACAFSTPEGFETGVLSLPPTGTQPAGGAGGGSGSVDDSGAPMTWAVSGDGGRGGGTLRIRSPNKIKGTGRITAAGGDGVDAYPPPVGVWAEVASSGGGGGCGGCVLIAAPGCEPTVTVAAGKAGSGRSGGGNGTGGKVGYKRVP
jgi:hypothetical protein